MLPSKGKSSSSTSKKSSDKFEQKSSASTSARSKSSSSNSTSKTSGVDVSSSSWITGTPSTSRAPESKNKASNVSKKPTLPEAKTSSTMNSLSKSNSAGDSKGATTDTKRSSEQHRRDKLTEILRLDVEVLEKELNTRKKSSPKVAQQIQPPRPRPSTAPTMATNAKQPFAALMKNLGSDPYPGKANSSRTPATVTSSFTSGVTTSSIASAAFAPFLKKYESPGLLPTPTMTPNIKGSGHDATGMKAKGGVWKRLGDIPTKLVLGGSNLSSSDQEISPPPVSPKDKDNEIFLEFRQRWEASRNMDKMKQTKVSGAEVKKVIVNQVSEIQVFDDNTGSLSSSRSDIDKDRKENRGTEKVLRAGSGGVSSGNTDAFPKMVPSLIKEDVEEISDTAVHRITIVKDSPTKILRDPLGRSPMIPSKQIKRLVQRNTQSRGRDGHRMPNSWKVASQQTGKDKSQSQHSNSFDKGNFKFSSTLTMPILEECKEKPSPSKFTSPLELQYPFAHFLTPQLKMFAWDTQLKAVSGFGWYNKTSSLLNPILPGIPRIPKPKDIVESTNISISPKAKAKDSRISVSTMTKQGVDTTWETPFSLRCVSNATNTIDDQPSVDMDSSDEDEPYKNEVYPESNCKLN